MDDKIKRKRWICLCLSLLLLLGGVPFTAFAAAEHTVCLEYDAVSFVPFGDAVRSADGGSVYFPGQTVNNADTVPEDYAEVLVNAPVEGMYRLDFRMVTTTDPVGVDWMTQNMTEGSPTAYHPPRQAWSGFRTMDYVLKSGGVREGAILTVPDTVTEYNVGEIYQYFFRGENRLRVFARGAEAGAAIAGMKVELARAYKDGSVFLYGDNKETVSVAGSEYTQMWDPCGWIYPLGETAVTYGAATFARGLYDLDLYVTTRDKQTDLSVSAVTVDENGREIEIPLYEATDLLIGNGGGNRSVGRLTVPRVYFPKEGEYALRVRFSDMGTHFATLMGLSLVPTNEAVRVVSFTYGLKGEHTKTVYCADGDAIPLPDASVFGYEYAWQTADGTTVTNPVATEDLSLRAVYRMREQVMLTVRYGQGRTAEIPMYTGEKPAAIAEYEKGFADETVGRYMAFSHWGDASGAPVDFSDGSVREVYAYFDEYSVINVEKNKRNADPFRILYVSDLHYGTGFGAWTDISEYTFASGKNLLFTRGREIYIPAQTPVEVRAGARICIDGAAEVTEFEGDQTLTFSRAAHLRFEADSYLSVPDGTEVVFSNGISAETVALLWTDAMIRELETVQYDAIFCLGDMVSDERNPKQNTNADIDVNSPDYHIEDKYLWRLVNLYVKERLEPLGIPCFFAYANHENCTDSEWEAILGYTKNYIVNIGVTDGNGDFYPQHSVVCVDTHAGYRDELHPFTGKLMGYYQANTTDPSYKNYNFGYGWPSDMKESFAECVREVLTDGVYATVAVHYASSGGDYRRLNELIASERRIVNTVMGHSHMLNKKTVGGKPAQEIGHFSWEGNIGHLLAGAMTAERVNDPNAWGMWNVYYVHHTGQSILGYVTYVEMAYGYLNDAIGSFFQPRFSVKQFVDAGNESLLENRYRVILSEAAVPSVGSSEAETDPAVPSDKEPNVGQTPALPEKEEPKGSLAFVAWAVGALSLLAVALIAWMLWKRKKE